MKYLNSDEFFNRLFERYKTNRNGWFYNNLPEVFGCEPYTIPANIALDLLVAKCIRIIDILEESYPLYVFNEGPDGWKHLKDNDSSPLQVNDAEELQDILQNHIYFQHPDGCNDNYSITNQNLDWFIVFCHHADWHFYAPTEMIDKVKKVDF